MLGKISSVFCLLCKTGKCFLIIVLKRGKEYQNYFLARDYKPRKVRKQFSDIRNISREDVRQPKTHNERFYTSCNLITQYNPMLTNIKTIIKKHLPVLHSNQNMLETFPSNTVNCHIQKR